MAAENGTIVTVTDGNSGTVRREGLPGGPVIAYLNPSHFSLAKDTKVTMTIDDSGADPIATILSIAPSNPCATYPDEGTVKTGSLSGNQTVEAGTTITFKGATITGKVDVKNGGKVIIKTDDNGVKTTITKGLNANQNGRVIICKSEIQGNVAVTNSPELTITGATIGSTLVSVNNGAVKVDATAVDGDVICNNSTVSAVITNCNITGNLEMHNNAGCSQSGNTVGAGCTNSGCVG